MTDSITLSERCKSGRTVTEPPIWTAILVVAVAAFGAHNKLFCTSRCRLPAVAAYRPLWCCGRLRPTRQIQGSFSDLAGDHEVCRWVACKVTREAAERSGNLRCGHLQVEQGGGLELRGDPPD